MSQIHRRKLIKQLAASGLVAASLPTIAATCSNTTNSNAPKKTVLKNNINHSVCQWTYNFISLEELCKVVKEIGFGAIDLIGPKDWPMLQKYGLYSSMCYNGGKTSIPDGFNDKNNHDQLVKDYTDVIPLMVKAGYKNVICFSGNRKGMDDETGLKNCVEGLQRILPLAEKNGITIQMELLNSKVNHKDYMCDKTPWGVELAKRLNSPNFKLLYDIYHMQIDEGDVIRTIQNNHQYFGHYHTGGNPGRHEIDDSQELYYPAIMKAIVATGYKGYVAQEFIPAKQDKIASLREAISICDV